MIDRYTDGFEFLPLKLEDVFVETPDTDIMADLSREGNDDHYTYSSPLNIG